MNKNWIAASFSVGNHCRNGIFTRPLELFEYLDVMGLFETSWMVYPHSNTGHRFGYPIKKT